MTIDRVTDLTGLLINPFTRACACTPTSDEPVKSVTHNNPKYNPVIAARLSEAADTARRLSPVRVQGYFNTWPQVVRKDWEVLAGEGHPPQPSPPTPREIDRMLETMRWVQWLEEDQRHLIWMRAKRCAWKVICKRFGCDRTTAWRRWRLALQEIAKQLNDAGDPAVGF